jgi:FKBP-type peptidyl-prolyl cis-trans isomerase FkpA
MKTSKIALLCVLALASACGDDTPPTSPSLNIPFSATDITVGTGTTAASGQTVRVYYTGWLYSTTATDNKGVQFETATTGLGLSFRLGVGQVIKGWDQGVVGMKVGGKRRLVIPPVMGYGERGAGGVIPPNATLVFDVELVEIH